MEIKKGTLVILKEDALPEKSRHLPLVDDLGIVNGVTSGGNFFEVEIMGGVAIVKKDKVLPITNNLTSATMNLVHMLADLQLQIDGL